MLAKSKSVSKVGFVKASKMRCSHALTFMEGLAFPEMKEHAIEYRNGGDNGRADACSRSLQAYMIQPLLAKLNSLNLEGIVLTV